MKTCPNPKINIGLNVLRKRPDGFHDLETLFVPYFGMADELEIVDASGSVCLKEGLPTLGHVRGRGPTARLGGMERSGSLPEANTAGSKLNIRIIGSKVDWDPRKDLTVKAYEILDADFNLPPVEIVLRKNIPVGAGLGGGSSDAAFALKMLNEMFSIGLDDSALAEYAARLGSDCAFFIYNRPMFGTGRGEVLEPYDIDLSAWQLRVEVPSGVAVSTAEAYRGVLAAKNTAIALPPLKEALKGPVECWKDVVVNDFEATVFPLHPEIQALKRRFYDDGAVYAAMSGSGSSVFGLFGKQ